MAIINKVKRALDNKKEIVKINLHNFKDKNLTLEKTRDCVREKVFNKSKMAKIQDIFDTIAFLENKGTSLSVYSFCPSIKWVPLESVDLGRVTIIFQGIIYKMRLYICFVQNDIRRTTAIRFVSYDAFEEGGISYKPLVDMVVSPTKIYPVVKNQYYYSFFNPNEFEDFSLTAQVAMFKAIDRLFNKAYKKIVDILVETAQEA